MKKLGFTAFIGSGDVGWFPGRHHHTCVFGPLGSSPQFCARILGYAKERYADGVRSSSVKRFGSDAISAPNGCMDLGADQISGVDLPLDFQIRVGLKRGSRADCRNSVCEEVNTVGRHGRKSRPRGGSWTRASAMSALKATRDVLFVASSGHEAGYLGIRAPDALAGIPFGRKRAIHNL